MELSAMLNDGPDEEKTKKQSPEVPKTSEPPTPIRVGGQQPPPPQYGPQPQGQPPPLYQYSVERPPSQGLAPLQVPHQAQYPYQQPPLAQSPAVAQQYRSFETYPSSIPGARGGSHGVPYSQPSPSQHHPGMPTSAHAHTTSLSPTPSSHHSQTPHSIRQSPLSAMSHAPQQPTTPLGPPPPQFSRSATHPDLTFSPYHQRTYSGASNGVPSGSPSQHYSYAGHHNESPNATYNRPSPQLRRTSDYVYQVERERSISVSPKTKVPPRPTSLGSLQGSHQDAYGSNRSSAQMSQGLPIAGSPSQGPQSYFGGPPPHSYAQLSNAASEVSQPTPSASRVVPNPFTQPGVAENTNSLSRQASYQHPPAPPPLIQHHSQQKMGMSNLLTPTSEVPPVVNGNAASAALMARENAGAQQGPSIFMKPSPKPKKAAVSATPPQAPPHHLRDEQPMKVDSAQGDSAEPLNTETKPSLKRSATEASTQQPPLKQRKTTARKYSQRPPWAQLSKHNPRFHQQGPIQNGGMPQQSLQKQPTAPQVNGPAMVLGDYLDGRDPWRYEPPLDMDLIGARAVLGEWEKTFRWNTPYPDMLRVVQDWLWQNLNELGDVGTDPREGQVEIEAKIGTLIDNNTDERLKLPVASICVIQPDLHGSRYSFRSEMREAEHKHLNEYLNTSIQNSHKTGRIKMKYAHLYEVDSFHHLSAFGLQLIPQALQRRHNTKKEHRLRITRDQRTGQITARIIKMKIGDLHIYNPSGYDCRITINLEVNLNRPDIDPNSLIAADDAERPNEPQRRKDRLSYQHLAYSIDLTKVEMEGMPSRYELEQEVKSDLLRQQMALASEGKQSAFGDVVSGFLDNLTFLMRERVADVRER